MFCGNLVLKGAIHPNGFIFLGFHSISSYQLRVEFSLCLVTFHV